MVVVKVSQEDKKPLKQSWFRSHIMLGSQETSDITLLPYSFGKNLEKVLASKPSRPFFHLSAPFV